MLHEVLAIIEQHGTVRFCHNEHSLSGRQAHILFNMYASSAERVFPHIRVAQYMTCVRNRHCQIKIKCVRSIAVTKANYFVAAIVSSETKPHFATLGPQSSTRNCSLMPGGTC